MTVSLTRRATMLAAALTLSAPAAHALDPAATWDRTDWPETLRIGVLPE